jgi:hypothetical protein
MIIIYLFLAFICFLWAIELTISFLFWLGLKVQKKNLRNDRP